MYHIRTTIVLAFFFGLNSGIQAQETGMIELVKAESRLVTAFRQLYDAGSGLDKDSLNRQIQEAFYSALENPLSFDFKWSQLDMIGRLESEDQKLKVFTWYLDDGNDNFSYYGFFQVKDGKKEGIYMLHDNKKENTHNEMLKQTAEDWNGKLFYQILTNTWKRETFYTLLGMDFNNKLSHIKTIEVLSLQRGKPQFEKEMFFDGRKRKDRAVFEYSSQVSMSLRFNPALDQIVFDHLVPFQSIYFGDYRFYGPDGSYDAYRFTDGSWTFEEDVDARNF